MCNTSYFIILYLQFSAVAEVSETQTNNTSDKSKKHVIEKGQEALPNYAINS